MDPFNTKGQTALEYLLIVVVAIIVVVAVMVFMQNTVGNVIDSTNGTVDRLLCNSKSCGTSEVCQMNNAKCGGPGACCVSGMCRTVDECQP